MQNLQEYKMEYLEGKFETKKFSDKKRPYMEGLQTILNLGYDQEDFIHHFPAFTGHMTIARFLSLYEAYKMVKDVAGHVAEVGVYKAAGTLFFAKLLQIFEPGSLNLVHGFDWFEGNHVTEEEKNVLEGSYKEDYGRVKKLVEAQQLENLVHIHKLDVVNELSEFFDENPYMQFKMVFLDAGMYEVVKSSIESFWPRLTSGGIMIFDQFNHELSPGETRAIKELLPNAQIKIFPFGWMPTAYVIKP